MSNLFLVRYPEEPLKVPGKGKICIGRTDDNDIVLHEPRASRKHASIQFVKPHYVLCDLGSSNGTYLNNTRLLENSPAILQNWDKIRIASAVFTIRIVEDQAEIMNEFKELRSRMHTMATEIINLREIWNQDNQPGFGGDLAHLCPVELFQMIESGTKSGILEMKTSSGEGSYTICDGQIANARFNDLIGEEAVYAVLNINQGTFTFKPDFIRVENPQINTRITFLLMEGCRRMDEEAMNMG